MADDRGNSPLAIFGGTPVRQSPISTKVQISAAAKQQIIELVEDGHLSNYYNGPWAREFERKFADLYGEGLAAIAVNSGTSALHLALTAAGVGPGDEVIVPALCFVAAATAIVQNGAIPIICDAEPDSLTMDVALVEELISPRTKAILVVHFWGYPNEMPRLKHIADTAGITLIEDCAQALGATIGEEVVGTFADYATFAFSVRKHVQCGEGGMVLCQAGDAHSKLRTISNYGKGPDWDDYEGLGFSYRLGEFAAIVAIDQLTRLDQEIAARRFAADYYRGAFDNRGLTFVEEPRWGRPSYFKCPVLLPVELAADQRNVVAALSAENVSSRVPHRPLFSIPWLTSYLEAANAYRGADRCPVAAAAHRRLFEVETGPHLGEQEVERTAEALDKVWRHYGT